MGCLPYNHRLKSTKIKHSFIFKALELVFLTGMRVLFVKQNHFSIFKLTFLLYGIYPHSRQEREKSSVKKKLCAILCIFSISILHSLREPGTKSRPFGLTFTCLISDSRRKVINSLKSHRVGTFPIESMQINSSFSHCIS